MHTSLFPALTFRLAIATALAFAAACAASGALAQAWPSRPVTLVVGTPPGSPADAYARALAERLAKQTGGNFVVENKADATGNLSAAHVLGAPADGATLWVSTQTVFTILPSVTTTLRWKAADFKAIAKGIESPLVLVTHPSVSAKTLPELAKWVTSQPNKTAYASFSPGTPSHFLGYQLSERLRLAMVHVPYKGSAPQIADLLAGGVKLGFAQFQAALPHIQAGTLNAIAVSSKKRTRSLPQVPTLAELGHPELNATDWVGLFANSTTPKAVLEQIQAATVKAQASSDFRAPLEKQGFDMPQEQGDAFATTIAADTAHWAPLLKATGFRASE